uniref:Uncharacterized protein n=1 Tax=Sphaerodactylus townsendi TaxID=933632 RepID=A0ACB8E7T1_9SAUR
MLHLPELDERPVEDCGEGNFITSTARMDFPSAHPPKPPADGKIIFYPPGVKEITDKITNDEVVKRLKIGAELVPAILVHVMASFIFNAEVLHRSTERVPMAVSFLADATLDTLLTFSRTMAETSVIHRILSLKPWLADTLFKNVVSGFVFQACILFGNKLEWILVETKDK